METMYKGVAVLGDGRTIEMTGTIMECANWSDNIVRVNAGEIKISITAVRKDGKK